jgi:hypothetical protein
MQVAANNNIGVDNTILVHQVKDKKTLNKLKKHVEQWQKIAEQKIKSFPENSPEHQVAEDAAGEAQAIAKQLSFIKKEKLSVFAAYNGSKKIQGIALAKIPPKTYASEIENMVVNPESIQLIGNKPVKGTGTALIKKIVDKVLHNKNKCKELRALALHAATPFYEKLGFTFDVENGGGCSYAEAMVLSHKSMKKLMNSKR